MRTVSFDMKPPKLLPWLARRAGVSDERAVALWRQALDEATGVDAEENTEVDESTFWKNSMERFRALLDEEARLAALSGLNPWFNLHDRLWRGGSLFLADAVIVGMSRSACLWRRTLSLKPGGCHHNE